MTIQCRLPPPYSSAQHHAPLIQHQGELLAQVQQASTDLRNDTGGVCVCVCVLTFVKLSERTRAFQETLLPWMLYALYVFCAVYSPHSSVQNTPILMKINKSLSSLWLASTKTWCLASQEINIDLKKKRCCEALGVFLPQSYWGFSCHLSGFEGWAACTDGSGLAQRCNGPSVEQLH